MTEASMPPASRPLVGVALVTLAVLSFAISDVLTKFLAQRHPVPVVVAMRYLISLLILCALLWPRHRAGLWRTKRRGLVVVRSFVLAFASLTLGYALRVMPVGETVSIVYLSPIAVMLLAAPVLGEKVAPVAWIGAVIGFCGVLLILRPGGGLDPIGVAFALANAALATTYHLMTRILTRSETTIALLFWVTLVGAVFFALAALPFLRGLSVAIGDVALMGCLGVAATLGHFLFTAAYREAPASMLAPVNYLHLFWAAGLGWVVFGHVPDHVTTTGMVLVAGAGVMIAIFARRARSPSSGKSGASGFQNPPS